MRRSVLLGLLVLAGCGSSSSSDGADPAPASAHFPAPGGLSLQAFADRYVKPGVGLGLASETFVPGTRRLSFALLDRQHRYLSGPAAVYVAADPAKPARGPFPAPSESLVLRPAYRSKLIDSGDIDHVYAANVPFRRSGSYAVLVVTRHHDRLLAAATSVRVRRHSPIPDVGDRPPPVNTDTLASTGDIGGIDTRIPHDDMHAVSFRDVLGKKPVALLFSTPALCQSRVCGPVTDVLYQLEAKYRGRVEFIHQEVYRDNRISEGLRPQLLAFHLRSEPWLFVVNRRGRIAARLEGAFGFEGAERAIQAALG